MVLYVRFCFLILVLTCLGQPARSADDRDDSKVKRLLLLDTGPLKVGPKDQDPLRRLLIARYNAAFAEAQAMFEEFRVGKTTVDSFIEPGKRLVQAGVEAFESPEKQIALRKNFLLVMQHIESLAEEKHKAGLLWQIEMERVRYERLDAEIQLLRLERALGKKGEAGQLKK